MKFLSSLFAFSIVISAFAAAPIAVSAQVYYPYAYNYQNTAPLPTYLSCSANVTTVRAGETVVFTAVGGLSNIYNWVTPERTYFNVGSQLSVVLYAQGWQTVTVSAGAQSASCRVQVLPPSGVTVPVTHIYNYPVTYFTSQYIPGMPNTGFEPITTTVLGFATVLLVAAGLFVSPYVKRTIASTFS